MNIFQNRSMVHKICLISIFCLTIPSLLFSFYLYKRQSNEFYRQLLKEQNLSIEQTANSVNSVLYSINELSHDLAYSDPLFTFVSRQYRVGLEKYPIWAKKQLNEVISSIKYSLKFQNLGISAANIFTTQTPEQEGDYFWSFHRLADLPFFQEFAVSEQFSALYYLNPKDTKAFHEVCGYTSTSADKDIILIIQKILNSSSDFCMGYLIFECSPAKIFPSTFSSQNGNYFAWFETSHRSYGNISISDTDKLPEHSPDTSAFSITVDHQQYIGCSLKNFDITVFSTQPLLTDAYKLPAFSLSLILAVSALIQLTVLTIFIRKSFDQLHKDLTLMDRIIVDGFHEKIPEVRTDEIGMIAHRYNILLDKINALIQETVQKETAQSHAQLKALQYQINPHFIYNTLSVFSGYASQNGQDTLAESIASFGQILRYNIKNDSLYASIDSELHCAYSLINVYNIRYFNQIQLTVDVPPALKQFRIIKFLLQPLLENSILHGLDQPGTSLDIFLSICLTDDFLDIELSDNGKGMSPERLAEVLNYMQHPSEELPASSKGSFIGLQNIYRRLKLFYGQSAQLYIESEEQCGTMITLHFPAIFSETAGNLQS